MTSKFLYHCPCLAWSSTKSIGDMAKNVYDIYMYICMSNVTWKRVFRILRPSKTQTGLLSYRYLLEFWNFAYSMYSYYTISAAKSKGAFFVRIRHKTRFLMIWLIYLTALPAATCISIADSYSGKNYIPPLAVDIWLKSCLLCVIVYVILIHT